MKKMKNEQRAEPTISTASQVRSDPTFPSVFPSRATTSTTKSTVHSSKHQPPPWAVKDHAELVARQAAHELGYFLRFLDWDWFATLTFSGPIHAEQAHKRFLRWARAVERAESRLFPGLPCVWARSNERQGRGVIHFHVLLGNVGDIPRLLAMKLWERIGGGHARIVAYDHGQSGAFYLAKEGEVDFSDGWFDRHGRRPKP